MAVTAGDLASRPAATCRASDSVRRAAMVMGERNVGSVVVVDDDRQVVGIITDRDLVLRVLSRGADADTPVLEAMTPDAAVVSESASALDAARQMKLASCRRLPVVNEQTGHVVGVVSADDLLERAGAEMDAITRCLAPMRRQLLAH